MYTNTLVLTLLTAVIHATRINDTTATTTDTTKTENPLVDKLAEDIMGSIGSCSTFNANCNINDYWNNS